MQLGKIRLFGFLAFLSLSLFLVSCRPDDDASVTGPSITFDAAGVTGDQTVTSGTTIHFRAIASKGDGGANLKSVRVEERVGSVVISNSDLPLDVAQYVFDQSYQVTATHALAIDETEVHEFSFVAFDQNGLFAERKINITLESTAIIKTPKLWEGVVFNNTNSYFSTLRIGDGALNQAQADASSSIDLTYYFASTSTNHSFVSPLLRAQVGSSSPLFWANGQVGTVYRTTSLGVADFDNAKANQSLIVDGYNGGADAVFPGESNGTRVGGLNIAQNRVIAFQGYNQKKGLILIKSVNNGSVVVDVVAEN